MADVCWQFFKTTRASLMTFQFEVVFFLYEKSSWQMTLLYENVNEKVNADGCSIQKDRH